MAESIQITNPPRDHELKYTVWIIGDWETFFKLKSKWELLHKIPRFTVWLFLTLYCLFMVIGGFVGCVHFALTQPTVIIQDTVKATKAVGSMVGDIPITKPIKIVVNEVNEVRTFIHTYNQEHQTKD